MSKPQEATSPQNMPPVIYPPEVIDAAIKSIAGKHYGFGGNCAEFAVVLNQALGGTGVYMLADSGDHYAYVDHVALKFQLKIYDGSGLITRQKLSEWAESQGGKRGTVSESTDVSVTGLVDSTGGGMGIALDAALLARDLAAALTECSLQAKASTLELCD
jgi:hypothetical protein